MRIPQFRLSLVAHALIIGLFGCAQGANGEGQASEARVLGLDGVGRPFAASLGPLEEVMTRLASLRESDATVKATKAEPAATLPHEVRLTQTRRVELDSTLGPAGARVGLDVAQMRGRVYLAVRSISSGAGSAGPRIDIVSSDDELSWRSELSLGSEAELYAPRLLQWGERLFAYVSELHDVGGQMRPRAVYATELSSSSVWAPWRKLGIEAQVVWRTKVERGIPLMAGYAMGEKTYEFDEAPLEVRLLTTNDGYEWHALQSGRRAVYRGAGSEAAFSSDDDGNLYTIVRNEASDRAGFGSAICSAQSSDWAEWDCVRDPKKYDSPVLFTHDGELYLIARRHASVGDRYETHGLSLLRRIDSRAVDLAAAKRCSVWHYDRKLRRVELVLDLPSKGDTCSPAVLSGKAPGEFVIYDHSSDVNGGELSLREGLTRPTYVYRHVITLH